MKHAKALAELAARELNFDPADPARLEGLNGWRLDEYTQPLPFEAPGEPEPGGSWEVARELIRGYEFADPALVRASFDPEEPLAGRDMLLELRFLFVRLRVGVRVGQVYDELRAAEGGQARVWGWDYRTLEGHIEQGQRFFEVWKHLATGAVEFRTHAYSRPARLNPVLKIGMWLFGRNRQAEFGRRACRRMAELTALRLGQTPASSRSMSGA